ncbi:MerR family transcriptional regulator [Paenibacillus nanensis]|uniref:MerR family transcriptional regulator n=1 Tax=Paenibacillus nanensis TaxID=393251 RepID=A0A3A1V081_9BACL|nr:MerR family transcriptional regulator [Paenibacillus nanensis]RIX52013.1 MerR family transcriptional regulator [Paenibacillus nanensis]
MKRNWKVGGVAQIAGLTVRTLRYYDQIGLYSPSGHTDSGHRIYTDADIARLQQILALKELGLSLEKIKSVMDGNQFSLLDIVTIQIASLKENISRQQNLLQELEHLACLIQKNETLSVQDFTTILSAMRTSHHNYFAERQASWNSYLDQLGDYLGESSEDAP